MPARSTVLVDGESSVVVSDAHWPVVVATWFGRPTETLVERYFADHHRHLERARSAGERLILITDTFATERPHPVARKRIVELTEAQGELANALTLKSFIVIENPVIRGVVTALAWVYPKLGALEHVGSLSQAVEGAATSLRSLGIPVPPGFTAAQVARPVRPT